MYQDYNQEWDESLDSGETKKRPWKRRIGSAMMGGHNSVDTYEICKYLQRLGRYSSRYLPGANVCMNVYYPVHVAKLGDISAGPSLLLENNFSYRVVVEF